ncbi:hypothetical protein SUGI_1092250 [Cryptomeria japonica]|nr:hypothetical protein SUGI_1092250 [Cryptomeria japonica]
MAMKYLVLAISIIIAFNNFTSLALCGGDTLLVGDSLAGNQTIMSKNDTFVLGFFCPSGTNSWYIGIWYARMSPKVIVWVANRDNPVRSMPGVLKFSSHRRLSVFDRKGRSLWSTAIGLKGSRAMITESGNFIMLGYGHNKSDIVWESFAHPGDTWLPGMRMSKGMKLTSWKSLADPAIGLFSYGMDRSSGMTQMVMIYNNSVPYWSSGEWTGSYFTKVPEGNDNKIFEMICDRVSPSRLQFHFRVKPSGHILTGRILLDENGELKVYLAMDDGTWNQIWSSHRGQCSQFEICGAYGLCNANDVCSCVEGFTPKNGSQGWWSSGCARRKPLQCSVEAGTTDGFVESKNRYLPEEEALSYNKEPTIEACRTACLNNCSCTAFTFIISDLPICRLWLGDLFKMRVSSENYSIFIRLAASELPHSTSERSSKAPVLLFLLPSAIISAALLALLLAAFILWKHRRLQKKSVEEDVPISLKTFTYKELRIATENFKHTLGSGAFGFGMALLEMISGRRNLDLKLEESRFYFPTWAASQIQRGNIIGVVDVRIASEANIEEVRRAAVVGELCIQHDENMRPSMGEVLKILEGTIEAPTPQIPRSLQLLVDQVEDDDNDMSAHLPCISSGFKDV